jgi:hypothetical protein
MSKYLNRKPSYEPEEVVSRALVRFLIKLNILNHDKHIKIIMRYRP